MDPIRIVSKIRNNRLQSYREGLNLSCAEFAEVIGIGYTTYLSIEACKYYPSTKLTEKIAAASGCDAEWLFPKYLKTISRTVAVTTIPDHALLPLTAASKLIADGTPESECEISELKQTIDAVLKTLTPKQEAIIRMRFGFEGGDEATLNEVAKRFCVTRERVRQIEAKALRKLRDADRSRSMKMYLPIS